MSTLYSAIFTDTAILIGRKWFKVAGNYDYAVPAGATVMRALASAVGGQGDAWGGGAAFARSKVQVSAGENIKVRIGDVSTATTLGDSWVKRNDNTTVICYADRGRGIGTPGLASNSIGDVTRDGLAGAGGVGGTCPGDSVETFALGFGGQGSAIGSTQPAGYGGGGHNNAYYDEFGVFLGYAPSVAGGGLVCLEFFDVDPGY